MSRILTCAMSSDGKGADMPKIKTIYSEKLDSEIQIEYEVFSPEVKIISIFYRGEEITDRFTYLEIEQMEREVVV